MTLVGVADGYQSFWGKCCLYYVFDIRLRFYTKREADYPSYSLV